MYRKNRLPTRLIMADYDCGHSISELWQTNLPTRTHVAVKGLCHTCAAVPASGWDDLLTEAKASGTYYGR